MNPPGNCSVTRSPAWIWPVDSDWNGPLAGLLQQTAMQELWAFVERQRREDSVFPAPGNVFRALELTPLSRVQFVILGQDPYHNEGQAHGLSFSVPAGQKHPPSLRNIFKELSSDTACAIPASGDLSAWARRGGLLLNTVLTVTACKAHSHRDRGWEAFTDEVISLVSERAQHVAFMLWGNPAREKRRLIDGSRHLIVESAHPSPLSAYRGFFGSRPFSSVNAWRRALGLDPVDWRL
jgi:uracil-DNA glycosylase